MASAASPPKIAKLQAPSSQKWHPCLVPEVSEACQSCCDIFSKWPTVPSSNLLFILTMVVPLLAEGLGRGIANIPHLASIVKTVLFIGLIYVLKTYFGGATCKSERDLHGKVAMITVGLVLSTVAYTDNARAERQA